MRSHLSAIAALVIFIINAATAAQQAQQAPPVPSISQRPTGSSLGTIRVGAADNTIWFGWRVGIPSASIDGATFSDALAIADTLAVTSVEASSTEITSAEVPKPLNHRLQPGERNAVNYRLRELNQQVLDYRVGTLDPDPAVRRKVFEFARAITAPLLVISEASANLAEVDTLAQEFGVDVAVEGKVPKAVLTAVHGLSRRIGVAANLVASGGRLDADTLGAIKERLLFVTVPPEVATGDFFLAA